MATTMDTISILDPFDQAFMYRRGSRSPTPTPEEQEKRAQLLQNDLLLHEAVIKNDSEAVKNILSEPLNINSRNNYGRAPIHWAASRGSTDIMKMLMDANCDIEARDKYGMRPILMAAWHGHKDAVEALVNAGAQTDVVNKKQFTLLICAAHNNRVEVVDYLLRTLPELEVDAVDTDGQTALFHAALGGHSAVLKRLVEANADPDTTNKEMRTALHAACEHGHEDVAEYLLEADLNVNMEACDSCGNTPLHVAATHQQTGLVNILLEHGADPDAENEKGFTALHIASNLGSKGIIEALVHHGSSLNKQSKNGSTPLHLACQANEIYTVEMLISKGADFNCLNNRLQSPMHIAAEMGYTEVCKVLLNAGANIDQREQGGKTPLYIAAMGSFTAIVDMIIKTARLDYPAKDEVKVDTKRKNSLKPMLNTARRRLRMSKDDGKVNEMQDKIQQILYKLAHKQLNEDEWKRLAYHWSFTDEQVRAIEQQYTGPASYKEHGHRMLLIWLYGLPSESNPIKELCEGLVAINKKTVADALKKKAEKEIEENPKESDQSCASCIIA